MDISTPAGVVALQRQTGFTVQPRNAEWIPLRQDIMGLITTKLAAVPWVPPEVITTLTAIPATQYNAHLIPIPVPTTFADGTPTPNRPAWLDTADKRIWWDDFAARILKAQTAFNAGQLAQGRTLMRNAQLDQFFWATAHNIAQFLALPVTLVEEGLDKGLKQFIGSTTGKVVMVGIVGFLIYKYAPRPMSRRRTKATT